MSHCSMFRLRQQRKVSMLLQFYIIAFTSVIRLRSLFSVIVDFLPFNLVLIHLAFPESIDYAIHLSMSLVPVRNVALTSVRYYRRHFGKNVKFNESTGRLSTDYRRFLFFFFFTIFINSSYFCIVCKKKKMTGHISTS